MSPQNRPGRCLVEFPNLLLSELCCIRATTKLKNWVKKRGGRAVKPLLQHINSSIFLVTKWWLNHWFFLVKDMHLPSYRDLWWDLCCSIFITDLEKWRSAHPGGNLISSRTLPGQWKHTLTEAWQRISEQLGDKMAEDTRCWQKQTLHGWGEGKRKQYPKPETQYATLNNLLSLSKVGE